MLPNNIMHVCQSYLYVWFWNLHFFPIMFIRLIHFHVQSYRWFIFSAEQHSIVDSILVSLSFNGQWKCELFQVFGIANTAAKNILTHVQEFIWSLSNTPRAGMDGSRVGGLFNFTRWCEMFSNDRYVARSAFFLWRPQKKVSTIAVCNFEILTVISLLRGCSSVPDI